MNYNYSDRVAALKPSAIREILKMTSVPGMVPLSAGNPAPEAFPTEAVAEISARIFKERPIDALQYSITEGYAPLREHLRGYMAEKHRVGREDDNLFITSGAQQVMDLATKSLCNPGDTIICEDPSFIGSLNAFRSYQAHLVGIPLEDDGMDMTALEAALKREKNVRFIYTIPNFQNPSGVTMSAEKRKKIYALAKRYGVLILEDNPYGDIRFFGEDIPTIKSLDEDGVVIYAGSFSKVLSPGIRVGFCVAPTEIAAKMIVCKQTEDVHTTIFCQMLCHEFMTGYDYEGHLERNRGIYRKKAELMMSLLDRHLAGKLTYHPIEGGLFIWCRLPDGVDMMEFCRTGVKNNVAVVPGTAFNVDETAGSQCFRINFSTPTDEQMKRGVETLGHLL